MSTLAVTVVLVMTITVYVPQAGGINGGLITASGATVRTGLAACGPKYPFGTVFVIHDDMEAWSLPKVVECVDRGGLVGNRHLDVVLHTGDVRHDLHLARQWGRRRREVAVYSSLEAYLAIQTLQRRLEIFGIRLSRL